MADLTKLDKEILKILSEDGRTPASDIARKLRQPATTIRNRIGRLEKLNVISGYKAIINRRKIGFEIKAIIQIQLENTRVVNDFIDALIDVEEVIETIIATGPVDAFLTVWVKDIDHLNEILTKKINLLPKVVRTNTLVVYEDDVYPLPITLASKIVDNYKNKI
jgi:Lrp/AsnC family transcriptional regulator for asnA, asnC and gidA